MLLHSFHVQEQSTSVQLIYILSVASIETLWPNICDRYVFLKSRADLSSSASVSFSFLGKEFSVTVSIPIHDMTRHDMT
jgi:hypothetical protein